MSTTETTVTDITSTQRPSDEREISARQQGLPALDTPQRNDIMPFKDEISLASLLASAKWLMENHRRLPPSTTGW